MLMVLDGIIYTSSTNHVLQEFQVGRKHKMHHIEIHFKGRINQQWSDWFSGLTISHTDPDETVLTGFVKDQAALYGIISHLRDLGLPLISVNSKEIKEDAHEGAK
jgi:hypothetical protein